MIKHTEYTLKVGEVFTKRKAKELIEYLEAKDKDTEDIKKTISEVFQRLDKEWGKDWARELAELEKSETASSFSLEKLKKLCGRKQNKN